MNSWANGDRILSCADAVGKALEWYLKTYEEILPLPEDRGAAVTPPENKLPMDHSGVAFTPSEFAMVRGACPDCGSQVEMQEGCLKCRSCGYTEC